MGGNQPLVLSGLRGALQPYGENGPETPVDTPPLIRHLGPACRMKPGDQAAGILYKQPDRSRYPGHWNDFAALSMAAVAGL